MGISNKIATKVRTRDRSELTNLPDPWDTAGAPIADAVIRAAVVTIGGLRLTSSGFRGSDFLGINSSRASGKSIAWFEREDSRTWHVSLGQQMVKGIAYDWKATFTVADGPQGREVSISTPAVATHDGTLMNKGAYGEVRELILEGFRRGRAPSLEAEAAASLAGFKIHPALPNKRDATVKTITTSAAQPAVIAALELIPFPRTSSADGYMWTLGTPNVDVAGAYATASSRDEGAQRVVTIEASNLPSTGFPALLVREQVDAIQLLTTSLIRKTDPDAKLVTIEPAGAQ